MSELVELRRKATAVLKDMRQCALNELHKRPKRAQPRQSVERRSGAAPRVFSRAGPLSLRPLAVNGEQSDIRANTAPFV